MRRGTGPQSELGGISKETRLRIQAPESFVSCVFLLRFFLGYFMTSLCPSFSTEPSPWPLHGEHHC